MSLWRWDFLHPPRLALGPTQPPVQRVKGPGCGVDHLPPSPSCTKVKEGVALYVYSPSGPSWPVLEWTLLFFFFIFYIYSHWSFLPCTWVFLHPLTTSANTEGQVNPKHQNALPQGAGMKKTESTLTTNHCESLSKVFWIIRKQCDLFLTVFPLSKCVILRNTGYFAPKTSDTF